MQGSQESQCIDVGLLSASVGDKIPSGSNVRHNTDKNELRKNASKDGWAAVSDEICSSRQGHSAQDKTVGLEVEHKVSTTE